MTEIFEVPAYTSWVAVAAVGPLIVAIEWKRGETSRFAASHSAVLRIAREQFAVMEQEGRLVCGSALLFDGPSGERWVVAANPARNDWAPVGRTSQTN